MNIVGMIQARMGSTRLPGKSMMKILGKPLLWYSVTRARYSKYLKDVVVLTSINPKDDIIEAFCKSEGIPIFRGPEEDVLSRYYLAAKKYNVDIIVRITADCPAADPNIIDKVIEKLISEGYDYVSNNLRKTYPHGLDVEAFTFKALEKANKNAKSKEEREHVTIYLRENKEISKANVECTGNCNSELRIVVDYIEDFEMVKELFFEIARDKIIKANWKEIVDYAIETKKYELNYKHTNKSRPKETH